MSNVPLPRPGPLGLIQYAGVDMLQYAGEVSAAKDAEISRLKHRIALHDPCNGRMAGEPPRYTPECVVLRAEVAGLRAELLKSLADNAALRADAIDRQNNVVAPLRERVRVLEDARPEPDCRTCKHMMHRHFRITCGAEPCTNGNRYQELPPVRLWRTAP